MKKNAKVNRVIHEAAEQSTSGSYSAENSLILDMIQNEGQKIDNWKPQIGGEGLDLLNQIKRGAKVSYEGTENKSPSEDKIIDANGKEVESQNGKTMAVPTEINNSVADAQAPKTSSEQHNPTTETPQPTKPDVGNDVANPSTTVPNVAGPDTGFGPKNPTSTVPKPSSPDASFGVTAPETDVPKPTLPDSSVDTEPTKPKIPLSTKPVGPTPEPPKGNSPPEICAVFTRNTDVTTEDVVDVYFNGRDPDWDPLSWDYSIKGSNGFSAAEVVGGTTPWIKITQDMSETDVKMGDQLVFEATVKDPLGQSDTDSITLDVVGQPIKVWETLFDYTTDTTGKGEPKKVDPLIFDLNMDGKLDITGANQEGNGKIDGATVDFDIDPTVGSNTWEFQSPGFRLGTYEGRPHDRIPPAPNGRVVYDTGTVENLGADGRWSEDREKGASAQIFNQDGTLVGEWEDEGSRGHGMIGVYYWGQLTTNKKEKTEWIKPGSGDGFLVWDHNGNGIIDDNTEMMSEFDTSGNKAFANGFEKLRHYFDKDGDGVVKGSETSELKFWVDDNGDAVTDAGELKSLSEYGISEIRIPQEGELTSDAMMRKS